MNIQGWATCGPLYSDMVGKCPDGCVMVEVGVWKGKSFCDLCQKIAGSGKNITAVAIDTFEGSDEEEHKRLLEEMGGSEALYREFLSNVWPYRKFVEVYRGRSLDAAAQYIDNSLFFVFIDASHEYKDVKADIEAWLPKIRQDGYLAGDDTSYPDVRKALIEKFGDFGYRNIIDSWVLKKEDYILGRTHSTI